MDQAKQILNTRAPGGGLWRACRGFLNGLLGALGGGMLYYILLAQFQEVGAELAGYRTILLGMLFGSFEMWRVRYGKQAGPALLMLLWVSILGGLGCLMLGEVNSPPKTPQESAMTRSADWRLI